MKNTFAISQAVETVAASLANTGDRSPTTIRCAINDTLDAADKDGFQVRFGYDQARAIRAVQREISKIRMQ